MEEQYVMKNIEMASRLATCDEDEVKDSKDLEQGERAPTLKMVEPYEKRYTRECRKDNSKNIWVSDEGSQRIGLRISTVKLIIWEWKESTSMWFSHFWWRWWRSLSFMPARLVWTLIDELDWRSPSVVGWKGRLLRWMEHQKFNPHNTSQLKLLIFNASRIMCLTWTRT